MKKPILLISVIFLCGVCKAQFIDNKVNIYFGCSQGYYYGNKVLIENDFQYPSLFQNYTKAYGLTIGASTKINENFSLALSFIEERASVWEYLDYTDYKGSFVNKYSIFPKIQIHNKFYETGVLNRLKVNFEFFPIFGTAVLTLANPVFEIQSEDQISLPSTSEYLFYGLGGGLGFEFTLTKDIGILLNYSINHSWISSELFIDEKFINSLVSFGFFSKFARNKHYYY